jgi:hypothetical protein
MNRLQGLDRGFVVPKSRHACVRDKDLDFDSERAVVIVASKSCCVVRSASGPGNECTPADSSHLAIAGLRGTAGRG